MGLLDAYLMSKVTGTDTVKKHAIRKMLNIDGANIFDQADTVEEKTRLYSKVAANEHMERRWGFLGWLLRRK